MSLTLASSRPGTLACCPLVFYLSTCPPWKKAETREEQEEGALSRNVGTQAQVCEVCQAAHSLLPSSTQGAAKPPPGLLCFHKRYLWDRDFLSASNLSPDRMPLSLSNVTAFVHLFYAFLASRTSMFRSANNFAQYLIHLLS